MTPEQIRVKVTPLQAVIATLYGEARGESALGQMAVACVIRNRVNHPSWWGHDFHGVCLTPDQFSCWWGPSKDVVETYAFAERLIGTSGHLDEYMLCRQLTFIAEAIMAPTLTLTGPEPESLNVLRGVSDFTYGATNYLTTALFRSAPPAWAKDRAVVAVIDGQTFFRLDA